MSKIDTRKIDNIQKNPHINLLFSDCDNMQQAEYVGNARIINDTESIIKILPKIQEALQGKKVDYWVPPLAQVPGDGYCIVEITPMSILYRDYSKEAKETLPHQYCVKL